MLPSISYSVRPPLFPFINHFPSLFFLIFLSPSFVNFFSLNVHHFKPSKQHRQLINKAKRFLRGDWSPVNSHINIGGRSPPPPPPPTPSSSPFDYFHSILDLLSC